LLHLFSLHVNYFLELVRKFNRLWAHRCLWRKYRHKIKTKMNKHDNTHSKIFDGFNLSLWWFQMEIIFNTKKSCKWLMKQNCGQPCKHMQRHGMITTTMIKCWSTQKYLTNIWCSSLLCHWCNDGGQTYHCASTKDHCKFAIFITILYYYCMIKIDNYYWSCCKGWKYGTCF